MSSIIKSMIGLLSPFNQLLLLQKLFTTGIIHGIQKIIPDYTNDDTGMYKIINYYGKNKENLSKIYFFLSLFAKQLNYGEYNEKTKLLIDDIKKRFFNLLDDIYKNNNEEIKKIIEPKLLIEKIPTAKLLKQNASKKKLLKSKASKKKLLKSKASKTKLLKSKTSKAKLLKSKASKKILLKTQKIKLSTKKN